MNPETVEGIFERLDRYFLKLLLVSIYMMVLRGMVITPGEFEEAVRMVVKGREDVEKLSRMKRGGEHDG